MVQPPITATNLMAASCNIFAQIISHPLWSPCYQSFIVIFYVVISQLKHAIFSMKTVGFFFTKLKRMQLELQCMSSYTNVTKYTVST
jgi:hypothetical protein